MVFKNQQTDYVLRVAKYVNPNELLKKEIFSTCHKIAQDIRTRNFQFKFLHDIVPNNYWLKKWQITETDICTFCTIQQETTDHLFWLC
jgi:hypothetical protein